MRITGSLRTRIPQATMPRTKKNATEFAIHCFREKFEENYTEALLLLDADKAYNWFNRELVTKNCENMCQVLYHAKYNSYSKPSALFVNQKKLLSKEGEAFAMAMYGIAVLPLIERVEKERIKEQR